MVSFRFRRSDDTASKSALANIVDAQRARAWLSTVVPLETGNNLHLVAELIGELMEGNVPNERKYQVLEPLRAGLSGILVERVRSIEYRSVPITLGEAEQMWSLVDTVEDLREAYEMLITRLGDTPLAKLVDTPARDARDAGPPAPTRTMALLRALDLNAQVLLFYQRMRVAVPERIWDQHCRMAQLARQLQCHNDVIEDPLKLSLTETARAAFVVPVLVALADPTALTPQEFQALVNCAVRWAGKVGYRIDSASQMGGPAPKPANNPGPVVSLAGDEHLVRLDTQKLLKSVARRVDYLDEGKSPQSIGLGEAVGFASARQLLASLQRNWGRVAPESIEFPEHNWRPSQSEFALTVVGLSAPPEAPAPGTAAPGKGASSYEYMRMRDDALTQSADDADREQMGRLLEDAETWTVLGETGDSVLCLRRHTRPGLSLGHIVGIKLGGKASAVPFLLGAVQGLQQGINDDHEGVARPATTHLVRVRLLPGIPHIVKAAVDQVQLDGVFLMIPSKEPNQSIETVWERARLSSDDFSLVVPLATFRPARIVRVVAGGLAAVVRLNELMSRGLDFDQVSFTMV
jgi:hypothetical protein